MQEEEDPNPNPNPHTNRLISLHPPTTSEEKHKRHASKRYWGGRVMIRITPNPSQPNSSQNQVPPRKEKQVKKQEKERFHKFPFLPSSSFPLSSHYYIPPTLHTYTLHSLPHAPHRLTWKEDSKAESFI
jgi:hypothetical protein